MRGRWLALCLVACAPPQYAFLAPVLAIQSPLDGPLEDKDATAMDGLTKHRWKTFDSKEACFESTLSDIKESDFDATRPFTLLAFRDREQPLPNVPSIRSTRVLVQGSGRDIIKTDETRVPLYHVTVESCFPDPGRIVLPSTTYVVLRVPYSTEDPSTGAGSRDGVWKLEHR